MNILKVFISVGGIKGISAILQIGFIFLINRKSNVEDSALYMWGLSAMMIFSTLIKFGVDNYIISSTDDSEIENKKNVSSCFFLISIAWLLFCIPFYFIYRHKLDITSSILFVLSVYFFSLMTFSSFIKQSERNFRSSAFLLNGQFYLLSSLCFYFTTCFIEQLTIVELLSVTFAVLVVVFLFNVLPLIIKYFVLSGWDLMAIIKKARFFYITSIISILMNWLPPFYAIYIIHDSNSISDIVTSQRVAIGVSFTLTIVNSFLGPLISKSISLGRFKEALSIYRKALLILCLTSTPIMAVCWFYVNELAHLFSVENYKVLLVLLFAQYVNSICGPVGVLLNMSGNSKYVTISSGCSLFVGLVLMSLLGTAYSSYGIAISVASMVFISNFTSLFWMYKIFYVKNSSRC